MKNRLFLLLSISFFTQNLFAISVPNSQMIFYNPCLKGIYTFPYSSTLTPTNFLRSPSPNVQKKALLVTDILLNLPSIIFGLGGLYASLTPQGALEANLQFLLFGSSLLVCSINNIVKSTQNYKLSNLSALFLYQKKHLNKNIAITVLSALTSGLLWKGFGIMQIDISAVILLLTLSTLSTVCHTFESYKNLKILKK